LVNTQTAAEQDLLVAEAEIREDYNFQIQQEILNGAKIIIYLSLIDA